MLVKLFIILHLKHTFIFGKILNFICISASIIFKIAFPNPFYLYNRINSYRYQLNIGEFSASTFILKSCTLFAPNYIFYSSESAFFLVLFWDKFALYWCKFNKAIKKIVTELHLLMVLFGMNLVSSIRTKAPKKAPNSMPFFGENKVQISCTFWFSLYKTWDV